MSFLCLVHLQAFSPRPLFMIIICILSPAPRFVNLKVEGDKDGCGGSPGKPWLAQPRGRKAIKLDATTQGGATSNIQE